MTETLFGRQVIFDIGKAGQPSRSFSDLRVSFQVDYKLDGKPNKATINVYNIDRTAFALAQGRDTVVRIRAGYEVPRQIFTGNPLPRVGVEYGLVGADRVLKILAQDARRKLATFVELTFATETTFAQIVDEIVRQGGFAVAPTTARIQAALASERLVNGLTYSGGVAEIGRRIATAIDADFQFRDDVLHFTDRQDSSGEPAVVFSTAAGNLLNLKQRKDKITEFTGLLDGRVRPGRLVVLEHADVTGSMKVRDVSFTGDTGYDRPFYVRATAKPISTVPV